MFLFSKTSRNFTAHGRVVVQAIREIMFIFRQHIPQLH